MDVQMADVRIARPCKAIYNPRVNAWPTEPHSRWCLPPFPTWWLCQWKSRVDSRCRFICQHRARGEKLLELATSLLACTILKKLLQHHTYCHRQWIKPQDSEPLDRPGFKEGNDADIVLPIDLENAYGRAFRSMC